MSTEHANAKRKFQGQELAAGGMTRVWSSGRFAFWVMRWDATTYDR